MPQWCCWQMANGKLTPDTRRNMNRTISRHSAILGAAQMSIHLPCATLFGKSHRQEETVADVQCKAVRPKANHKRNQISNAQRTIHSTQRTWPRHTKKRSNEPKMASAVFRHSVIPSRLFVAFHLYTSVLFHCTLCLCAFVLLPHASMHGGIG